MKKISLILLCFVSFQLFAQKATIYFQQKNYDYGTIKEEDGPAKCTFEFTNMGDDTLKVTQVRASCGCTASDYTKAPIPPGGKGFIHATYNPRNRPGNFKKSLTVVSNDTEHKNVILYIQGKVIPRPKTTAEKYPNKNGSLKFMSNHLAFMDVLDTQIKKDSMAIYNDGKKTLNLRFKNLPPFLTSNLPIELKAGEEGWLVFTYDAAKRKDYGYVFDKISIITNDDVNPLKPFNVSANIVQDFSSLSEKDLKKAPIIEFDTTVYSFDEVTMGDVVNIEFTFYNRGKRDLKILKTKASCGCTTSKLESNTIKKKGKGVITVNFNTSNRRGNQHKTVTVICNDPKNPVTVLHIQGRVK